MSTSEQALGELYVAHLKSDGWEVYQEVQPEWGGPRADIVATQGAILMVVELKKNLGLALLEQLDGWKGDADLIVGVTWRPARGGNRFAMKLCQERGFGLVHVEDEQDCYDTSPKPHIAACLCQPSFKIKVHAKQQAAGARLRRALASEQQSGAQAGSKSGGSTPFTRTVRRFEELVAKQPGLTIRAAVEVLDHHYANNRSARNSLSGLIRAGVIESVELRGSGRRAHLHTKGTK